MALHKKDSTTKIVKSHEKKGDLCLTICYIKTTILFTFCGIFKFDWTSRVWPHSLHRSSQRQGLLLHIPMSYQRPAWLAPICTVCTTTKMLCYEKGTRKKKPITEVEHRAHIDKGTYISSMRISVMLNQQNKMNVLLKKPICNVTTTTRCSTTCSALSFVIQVKQLRCEDRVFHCELVGHLISNCLSCSYTIVFFLHSSLCFLCFSHLDRGNLKKNQYFIVH